MQVQISTSGVNDRFGARAASTAQPKGPSVGLLVQILEEINHGVLLLTETAQVRFANRTASRALLSGESNAIGPICLQLGNARDQSALLKSLQACGKGCRSLLNVHSRSGQAVALGISPIDAPAHEVGDQVMAMVTLGKNQNVDPLGLQFFAQTHHLTLAESHVLERLCKGMQAPQIAAHGGVACSTIRSQIRSITHKTHARGIRDIVSKVMLLPPMASALHCVVPQFETA